MGSPGGEVGRSPDEGPPQVISITRPFYLGAHPVTQEQYQHVAGVNPSHFRVVPGHDTRRFPVENVSWEEAVGFCKALSSLPQERRHGRTYRLPSEAEWEYCCRAGQRDQTFSFGRNLSSTQANFDGRHPYGSAGRGDFLERPTAVGSYLANAFGLYDMHGNVWEWVADWYSESWYRNSPRVDPAGPPNGSERVLRGGSWQNHGRLCRSACRDRAGVSYRSLNAGFRVVLEVRKG
jgi:formylglycine-generating enzyme required for sulfatase activity